MIIYMYVEKDEYELPLAIADSPKELAEICGVTRASVSSGVCHDSKGRCNSRFKRVIVEDNDE